MLKLCKEAHEEVAFASTLCPCCMIINHFREKMEQLEGELAEAKEYIEVIQEENTNAPQVQSIH